MGDLPEGSASIRPVRRDQLISRFPTLYHMAEDGTWPSISSRGLLSTRALVDLLQPDDGLRYEILNVVRRDSITLDLRC